MPNTTLTQLQDGPYRENVSLVRMVKNAAVFTPLSQKDLSRGTMQHASAISRYITQGKIFNFGIGRHFMSCFNISEEKLKAMAADLKVPSFKNLERRLNYPKGFVEKTKVLVFPIIKAKYRTSWFISTSHYFYPWPKNKIQEALLKAKGIESVDYLLVYLKSDPEVARLFRVDKDGEISPTMDRKEFEKEHENLTCPRNTPARFIDYKLDPKTAVDLCEINLKDVFKQTGHVAGDSFLMAIGDIFSAYTNFLKAQEKKKGTDDSLSVSMAADTSERGIR